MELYNPTTNTSITEQEFRNTHSDKSMPLVLTKAILSEYGLCPVLPSAPPAVDHFSTSSRNGIELDSLGNYIEKWQVINMATDEKVAILTRFKANKNAEINEARAAANNTTFFHNGKNIACDELSKTDILCTANYIALFGSFAPGFPNGWKAVDNTYLNLPTLDSFKSMYASMVNAGNSNFMHAQQLKQELAAATTVEQINSITW